MRNLPRDSAYTRWQLGDRAYWDEGTELAAQAVDSLRELVYVLLRVNGNDARMPEPTPRPGPPIQPETVSLAEFASLIKG